MARQSADKAGQFQGSQTRTIKTLHKNTGAGLSLKDFARRLQRDGKDEGLIADAWFFNKRLNAKAPLKKIGRTRKRVKSGGQQPKKS